LDNPSQIPGDNLEWGNTEELDHLPYPKTQFPWSHHRHLTFRRRGFVFHKKAGTNRQSLARYMWQEQRSWVRYAKSVLVKKIPALAPQPIAEPTKALFHYSPPVKNHEDFSFVIVGDTGMNSPGQYLVSTALSRQDLYPSEFCMILGDVMYPAGGEESYKYGLLEAFKYYRKPILALPGNHDWYDNLGAFNKFFIHGDVPEHLSQQYAWDSPKLPNFYYHMDLGTSLRIICLDSGITGELSQNRQAQLEWLDTLLETAENRKVILMMHHPIYSLNKRGHEKRLRRLIEPRLQKANVVALFAGHDHSYQRHQIGNCQHIVQGAGGATIHKLPDTREIQLANGETHTLSKKPDWDQHFSFTLCRWQNNQLTCTTVSAHQLPGRILDQFVL
jgi:hypothetical protein